MAKATLPTNYKDDIMASSMAGKRRYNLIQNSDGTVSLEDVTNYTQVGSNFGAAQMNQTNTAVNNSADKNKIIDSLADVSANTQGGMMAGALAVRELNSKLEDSGWVDCTLGTNISIDNPENGKPKVRKIGNMVILSGTIKSNTTWSNHDALIKIPDGYRPKKYERFICAATGQYMHRLDIPPSGTCTDYILNGKQIPSGGWLQLEGIWYV